MADIVASMVVESAVGFARLLRPLNQTWAEAAEVGWVVGRGKEAGWKGAAGEKPLC